MKRTARVASLGLAMAMAMATSTSRADEATDVVPLTPLALAPATAASASPATTPPSAGIDTVQLRNGTVYRGQVLEIQPNSHVSIAVPGAGTKKVAWADVEKVIVASYTGPLPPSTTAGTPAPYVAASTPLDAPMQGPRARVRIHAKTPVLLYRKPAGTEAWSKACASPCDVELPIGDAYRLTGNGVPQTKEFRLEAPAGGSVEISFAPPSMPGMLFGGTLAYGGAIAAYVGLLVTLASTGSSASKSDARTAGLVTMGVGTGVGVLGLLLFLHSSGTDIDQKSGAARAEARRDAFVRTPSWKAAPETDAATAPTFPLVFTGTF
jgi:hypothetical protein